jgi:hypothetical protein
LRVVPVAAARDQGFDEDCGIEASVLALTIHGEGVDGFE